MDDDKEGPKTIGWLRAILSAVAIVVVAIAVLVYGSNAVLTMHGKTRSSLVGIVAPLFFVFVICFPQYSNRISARAPG